MGCHHFNIDGVRGILCTRERGRKRKCASCKEASASLLCDFLMRSGKTCDKPLCRGCAVKQASSIDGDSVDYCPRHAEAADQTSGQLSIPLGGPRG